MRLHSVVLALLITMLPAAAQPAQRVVLGLICERPGASLDSPIYLAQALKAVAIAIEERRAEFLQRGWEIELKTYFTSGERINTYHAVKKALEEESIAAVGLASSDEAAVSANLLTGTDYVIVSPLATSTSLLALAPNLLLYAAPNAELADVFEATVTQVFKPQRMVAIVTWDSAFSQNFYLNLSESFRAKVALIKIQEKVQDIHQVVESALAHRPDVILLPDFPVITGALMKAFVDSGFKGRFAGPDSWGEGNDRRLSMILEGIPLDGVSVRQFSRFRVTPRQQALQNKLMKKDSGPYVASSGLYYDSMAYVLTVLAASSAPTRAEFLRTAQKMRVYDGLYGKVCLSALRCPGRDFALVHLGNGGIFHLSGTRQSANTVTQP